MDGHGALAWMDARPDEVFPTRQQEGPDGGWGGAGEETEIGATVASSAAGCKWGKTETSLCAFSTHQSNFGEGRALSYRALQPPSPWKHAAGSLSRASWSRESSQSENGGGGGGGDAGVCFPHISRHFHPVLWHLERVSAFATWCPTYRQHRWDLRLYCYSGTSCQLESPRGCRRPKSWSCWIGAGRMEDAPVWREGAAAENPPPGQKGPVWRWSSSRRWSCCCDAWPRPGPGSWWCGADCRARNWRGSSWAPECPKPRRGPV